MGRCRSHEFMEYRGRIMDSICTNERLIRLLTPDDFNELISPSDLPYKFVFPYELITGTQTKKQRFIGFDISAKPNVFNHTFKDMVLDFFIICDENLIAYPDPDIKGYTRCWYDLVVCELEEMFLGDNPIDIGVGKFEFKSNEPYFVSYAREIPFKGRTWSIEVNEWMNGKKYGK